MFDGSVIAVISEKYMCCDAVWFWDDRDKYHCRYDDLIANDACQFSSHGALESRYLCTC